jgi:hypothetical protein
MGGAPERESNDEERSNSRSISLKEADKGILDLVWHLLVSWREVSRYRRRCARHH